MRVLLVAMLLLAGCASKDPSETADPVADPEDAIIRGVVVDAAVVPVEGATVQLNGAQTVEVDSSGNFDFIVTPGTHVLQAQAPGHLAAQTTVLAVAGTTQSVRFQLLAEQGTEPYPETQQFDGFAQASAGLLTPVLDQTISQLGFNACDCAFQVFPDPGLSRIVIEATWGDSVAHPAEPTEFVWQVEAQPTNATASGQGPDPIRRVLSPLDFPAQDFRFEDAPTFEARLYPDPAWPAFSQEYSLFVSLWYRGAPPTDWSII